MFLDPEAPTLEIISNSDIWSLQVHLQTQPQTSTTTEYFFSSAKATNLFLPPPPPPPVSTQPTFLCLNPAGNPLPARDTGIQTLAGFLTLDLFHSESLKLLLFLLGSTPIVSFSSSSSTKLRKLNTNLLLSQQLPGNNRSHQQAENP